MTRAYKKYQVLLVEDDKEQASMCINSFSKNSIKADLATSKKDATRLVSNNSYDAIIIDSAIKGTTGMEILTDIKKLNTDVPILMLAEHESPLATADVVKSILSGAFECIVKEPNYWDMLPKLIEVDINKYRISRINEQMQDEVRRFSYIVENIDDCVIMIDSRGRITYTNRSFNSRYGYEKDEIIGKDILAILSDTEVQNNGIQRLFLDRNQYSRSDEFSMIAKSGEQIQSLATVMTIRNSRNMIISSVILLKDITERKKAEEELTRSRDFYLTLLDTFPALIWKSDTNAECNYFNSSWLIFTGSTMEKSVGYRWLLNVHPEDRQKRMDTYLEAFTERKPFEMEYRLRRHDGVYRWVVDMGRPYNDLNGNFAGYIGSCYDITNRKLTEKALKESEERFKHISFHDELTGIYNRSYFEQEMSRLDREFSKVKPLSIISIDIDGLKMINDTFGHKAGDKLLTDASKIISAPFKEEGTVFRIGGDEFCVILPGYDNAAIRAKKEEIKKLVNEFNKKKPRYPISMSIGVATTMKGKKESIYDVYQRADDNMYKYKLSQVKSPRSKVIDMLLLALSEKDFIAYGHVERLSKMAGMIADRIHLSDMEKEDLILLAKMHDLGKVGIPDEILFKPSKLSKEEYEKMKNHVYIGYKIANRSKDLSHISNLILHHHENWDGSGYPDGLKGDQIPILCRMVSIIDAYDAMTSDRPYRKAMTREEAISELKRCSGSQFDPDLVKEFLRIIG